MGRLMMDVTSTGTPTLIDPETAAELSADRLPAFVLSTEGEATDGNIVRAFWDLSRADTVGIPVLWAHQGRGEVLGQWRDLGVRDMGGAKCLVGRTDMDMALPAGAEKMGQIRRGYVRGVSVGWQPGEVVRRGALDPGDKWYRKPIDGDCGPEEGLVMGSETAPNVAMEGSLCGVPADPAAFATERQRVAAERAVDAIGRGSHPRAIGMDLDALLATVAVNPGARAFLSRLIDERIAHAQRADGARPSAPGPSPRTFADLFSSRST